MISAVMLSVIMTSVVMLRVMMSVIHYDKCQHEEYCYAEFSMMRVVIPSVIMMSHFDVEKI
jgi:hypothetical protein